MRFRTQPRTSISACLLLLAMLAVAGCKPAEEGTESTERVDPLTGIPLLDPKPDNPVGAKVLLLLPNLGDPFQRVQASVLNEKVRAIQDLDLEVLSAGNDALKQMQQLRSALAEPPRILMIRPVNTGLVASVLSQLHAAGAMTIGMDPDLPSDACDFLVYCDQRQIGKMAGEYAIHALSLKAKAEGSAEIAGRVAMLRGNEIAAHCLERGDGFQEALRAQPGIILVHDAPASWNAKDAAERMREIFRLQKVIDVVYAQNDLMARGASEAATEASQRENMLIIGTDGVFGGEGGLDLLKDSVIDATVYQPLLVDLALDIARQKISDPNFQPKPRYEAKPHLITPKNIDEVLRNGVPKSSS